MSFYSTRLAPAHVQSYHLQQHQHLHYPSSYHHQPVVGLALGAPALQPQQILHHRLAAAVTGTAGPPLPHQTTTTTTTTNEIYETRYAHLPHSTTNSNSNSNSATAAGSRGGYTYEYEYDRRPPFASFDISMPSLPPVEQSPSSQDVIAVLSQVDRPFSQISSDIAALEQRVRMTGNVVGSTFHLALHEIYPVLTSELDIAVRLSAAFVLYDVYRGHDFALNPFRAAMTEHAMDALVAQAQNNYHQVAALSPAQFIKSLSSVGLELAIEKPVTQGIFLPLDVNLNAQSGAGEGVLFPAMPITSKPSSADSSARKVNRPPITIQRPIASPPQPANAAPPSASSLLKLSTERVLTLRERRLLLQTLDQLTPDDLSRASIEHLAQHNAEVAYHVILFLLGELDSSPSSSSSPSQQRQREQYSPPPPLSFTQDTALTSLSALPPTSGSCDLLGRLITLPDGPLKELIRDRVLPIFLERAYTECENQMEFSAAVSGMTAGRFDNDVEDGVGAEETYQKTVRTVCMFAKSMMTSGILSPWDLDSEPIVVGMRHFALTHSRVKEASGFYRAVLAFENP